MKSESWQHLKSAEHLKTLFTRASDVLEKRTKSKATREFLVELKELQDSTANRKVIKSGGDKKPSKKEKAVRSVPYLLN